jgi:cell division protein FtsQ
MIRKIAHIALSLLLILGTFILLGFAVESNSRTPVQKLDVRVDHQNGNHFLEAEMIRGMVKKHFLKEENTVVSRGKLRDIEKLITNIPHVDRAHVYRTIDGSLHIKTTQREPLIRVVNTHNESYYIDTRGRLMPLSNNYTARVRVATGHIQALYSPAIDLAASRTEKEIDPNEKRLRELYRLATYISQHEFWNAFIDHIYVTPNGEFELTPKNGAHIVEFGNTEQMEEKFRKLQIFYQSGLTRVGWHHYRRVNVKYSNQVVCSK